MSPHAIEVMAELGIDILGPIEDPDPGDIALPHDEMTERFRTARDEIQKRIAAFVAERQPA